MGIELPAVVPAGPDNPMGHHAIRLAAYGGVYLLHGTNADFGIGMRVSSGCIRLRDNDIKALYNTISPGTKVNIINTPIKASVEPDGRRLVEVHQPLSEHIDDDPQTLPITLNAAMTAFKQAPQTDGTVMERAMNYRSGMPIDVTRHAEPRTAVAVVLRCIKQKTRLMAGFLLARVKQGYNRVLLIAVR